MNDDIRPRKPAAATTLPPDDKPPQPPLHHEPQEVDPTPLNPETAAHKTRPKKRFGWLLSPLQRRQLVVLAVILGITSAGGVYGLSRLSSTNVKEANSVTKEAFESIEPEPKTVASRLTGRQVAPELNELPLTGVMIENSPDARPQSGLRGADMVFEAIAEGGITRFLALYQESQPEYIGPVRSVRPYYLDFAVSYDAAIAHAGGSAVALAQIRSQRIKDLDHGPNAAAYQRVSSRYAPHNLYTSRAKLLEVHKKRGYNSSDYKGFARKAEESPAKKPTARAIEFGISSFLYNVSYKYDPAKNNYPRTMGGKPHIDERSRRQIAPKVVIALVMKHRYDGIYSVYGTSGTGTAYVFQDGIVTKATWHKSGRKSELSLTDAKGKAIELNPGQTWLTLVANASAVSYTP